MNIFYHHPTYIGVKRYKIYVKILLLCLLLFLCVILIKWCIRIFISV